MERPVKRQRIAIEPLGTDDDDDELDCEPNELNQRRDPVYQLEQARARASNKLKSRFEDIFAKYEKDFTGVGDEIDLRTGELVVNNGHLQSLSAAQEFGAVDQDQGEDEDEDAHFSGNDGPVVDTTNGALEEQRPSEAGAQRNLWGAKGLYSPRHGAGVAGPAKLSSMIPPPFDSPMPPGQPFGSLGYGHTPVVDPAWQAPELPRSAFMSPSYGAQARRHIFGMGQTTKVTNRSLLEPRSHEGDEEDVLLGVSDNILGKKESPLIKSKFPAVGSSPNNDPGLHEMIQDVMKTIADTSPLSKQSRKGTPGTRTSAKSRTAPMQAGTAVKGKQEKNQTGETRRSSTGKTKVTPSCRMDATGTPKKKSRGRWIAGTSPSRANSIRDKRRPKTYSKQPTAYSTGEPDSSDAHQDFVLDVTGNTPVKPARQTLYVDIKARKVDRTDFFSEYCDSELESVVESSLEAEISASTLQLPSSGILDAEEEAADTPLENCTVEPATNRLVSEPMDSDIGHGPSESNKTNPPSALARAGALLRGEQKPMPAVVGVDDHALQESDPAVPKKQAKERFERNVMDPSYAFSDEETMLPRRKRLNRRNPAPANRASLNAEDASRFAEKAQAGQSPQTTIALDASDQEKRCQRARTSPQPLVERDSTTHATEVPESSQQHNSEQMGSENPQTVSPSALDRQNQRHKSESQVSGEPEQQSPEKPRSLEGRSRKKTIGYSQGRSEPGHKDSPVAASTTGDPGEEKPPSAGPLKTAGPAPVLPSTPQSKSRSRVEKAHISSSGLISLLSDDDDEEDEISFNLADFTPSGHHRILALRPNNHQSATASTGKKRRVASLLFGPASTSKVSKHSTPYSGHKPRKRRRRSTNILPGSVAKVKRDSPRAPSPAVSVVQTPGGTKRRCGEDGFRCERDFCFICISI